jgi:hypothetical protein
MRNLSSRVRNVRAGRFDAGLVEATRLESQRCEKGNAAGMSTTQEKQCQLAEPVTFDAKSAFDHKLILETLSLHSTAINTALRRHLALEARVKELQAGPVAAQPVAAAAPGSARTANWLTAALEKKGPEDAKPVIYFFHIPKTAGTSFYRFLVRAFGETHVSPQMLWDGLPEHTGTAANWKVWSGHFGGLLPFILPSWPRMVTILRDPVDRTLSHINQVRRDKAHPLHAHAQGLSVLEYCRHPRLRRSVDNYQARFLASLSFALAIFKTVRHTALAASAIAFENALFSLDPQYDLLDSAVGALAEMEMVGIAEAHDQTLRLFARKFDLPAPTESYQENRSREGQLRRADLSPEELECIEDMTRIDRLVYGHARMRFETDCRHADPDGDLPRWGEKSEKPRPGLDGCRLTNPSLASDSST